MTSRQRVLTALQHQQPDRTPIDLSGHRSSGISALAYARLRDYLGLPKRPIRVYDVIQQLAIVDEDLLNRFHVDTIELGRAFATNDSWWHEWELPDGTACLIPTWVKPVRQNGEWILQSKAGNTTARMPPGVLYFEQSQYPFATKPDINNLEDYFDEVMWTSIASPPGPVASGPNRLHALAQGATELRQSSNRAILALFGGNLLEMGQFFYRNDNFLLLLAANPAEAHQFLDKVTEIHLRNLKDFLYAVGPHVDIIVFGDDFGMQHGPQISPRMYQEFFQPRQKAMWDLTRQLAPHINIQLHCCGGIRPLLPGLIQAGLQSINPVQITCKGMNPAELKAEFGQHLTFWGGGCNTRDVLSHASPDEIKTHVQQLNTVWNQNGGHVFQQVHNILADVPPANVVAMYDAIAQAQ